VMTLALAATSIVVGILKLLTAKHVLNLILR